MNIYHAIVNVNLMVENVTQIKSGISEWCECKKPKEHHMLKKDYI